MLVTTSSMTDMRVLTQFCTYAQKIMFNTDIAELQFPCKLTQ